MTTIDQFLQTPNGTVAVLLKDNAHAGVAIRRTFREDEGIETSISDYSTDTEGAVEQFLAESDARIELLNSDGSETIFIKQNHVLDGVTEYEVLEWLENREPGTVIFAGRSDTRNADFSVCLKLTTSVWITTACDFYGDTEAAKMLDGYSVRLLPEPILFEITA